MKLGFQAGQLIPAANVPYICHPDSPQKWTGLRFFGLTIGQTFIGFMWRSRS